MRNRGSVITPAVTPVGVLVLSILLVAAGVSVNRRRVA
jgi:hypothetical protein